MTPDEHTDEHIHEERWSTAEPPPLEPLDAHVWRIALDDQALVEAYRPLLSPEETLRADRFHRAVHRDRYVIAHGALRLILGAYTGSPPTGLAFHAGPHGKPSLLPDDRRDCADLEFNLSHSGDLALVAVARGRPLGVDVERWSEKTEHLAVAERFFSPLERDALRALAHAPEHVVAGFFAAWSRKEAYLKATGHGISRGLHHFDVTLAPGEPALLIADRLDELAHERWSMMPLHPAPGYSAALVVATPLREVLLFDAARLRPG